MLVRLRQLKTAIVELADNIKNLRLTSSQWKQIDELADTLAKCYDLTLKMQFEDLTLGYFYRKWTGLKLILADNGSLVADGILESMRRREPELFSHPLVLAAVYLDAKNCDLLSAEQKEIAKKAVVELACKIKGLADEEDPDCPAEELELTQPAIEESDSDEDIQRLRYICFYPAIAINQY